MRGFISFWIVLSAFSLSASCSFDSLTPRKSKIPYIITAGYRCPIIGNNIINSGQGTYFEIGFNIGKFISSDLVMAPFIGWGHMGRLWSTSVDRNFSHDYHAEVSKLETNGIKNEIAHLSADYFKNKKGSSAPMPGCAQNSFHNYSLYAGFVMGSTHKFFPLVKVYAGSDRIHYQGDGGELQHENSLATLQLRRNMYGCEILKTNLFKSKCILLKSVAVGIYYEYYSFTNSKLYFDNGHISENILMKDLTSASFKKKYQHSQICGAKIALQFSNAFVCIEILLKEYDDLNIQPNRRVTMTSPLIKQFTYNASIEKVWEALTDKDKMKIWYFPQLQEFEPIVGFKFKFDQNAAEYQKEWIVTKVSEGKTLAHSWAYKGYKGTSEVIFDLFFKNNETKLIVTQTGLETFPDQSHFKRERFEWGWDTLLGYNLKNLVEE